MNCTQAKNISIIDFLTKEGHSYSLIKNTCAWYCSPFRNEKEPSFKVDLKRNTWYDFASGDHGNIIDLAKLIFRTDLKGALQRLSGFEINLDNSFSFQQQDISDTPGIKIKHTQALQNKALIQYCELRKIPYAIAKQYLIEAYYSVNDKGNYFSLAFKNDLGGYELRNSICKNCAAPKHITTIPGANHKVLTVFEGFFDFLSACVYFKSTIPNNDTIILNSLTFVKKSLLQIIPEYEKINLFLDNDSSGEENTVLIQQYHENTVDYSKKIYPNNNDFNEYLIKNSVDTGLKYK